MVPQHLQQQDLYHERLLGSRLDALEPLNWGVVRIEIDAQALAANQIQLNRFFGVMPDGLVLNLEPGHPELPPSRPIEAHFPAGQSALELFLAIPRERENASNLAPAADDSYRFSVEKRSVRDLTGGDQDAEVAFAKRTVLVRFGDESRDDFTSMKIAELVRDDTGGLLVSEPYIPPCLRIDASPFIIAGLKRLYGLMTNRHKALSEARRQSSKSTVEFAAPDVTRFLLLATINGFMPVIKHMIELGDLGPRAAYLALCQLAGQLSTFSVDADPTGIPRFSHTDLRSTFETLFARLVYLLQATVEEHCITLPLQPRADGVHLARFEELPLQECDAFLIAVRGKLPEQQIATQLPRLCKIASWAEINDILDAATPGAAVEVTYRPPPEVPVKAGLVYFTISTDNAYWRNVIQSRSVAVFLPLIFDPRETQVQLLGIPARGAAATSHRPAP